MASLRSGMSYFVDDMCDSELDDEDDPQDVKSDFYLWPPNKL